MQEGSVVLVALPQADGQLKPRPALVLRYMPPFQDLLLTGISSQLRQAVPGFDEILLPGTNDFADSGLRTASVVRLGFLTVLPHSRILGELGVVTPALHQRLLRRLSDFLLLEQ